MEPPTKRPRLSIAPDTSQDTYPYPSPSPDPTAADENEINHENENEYDQVDIHAARAQNDQRLKTIFESIFEKYSRDFTEVGDEIDLQTGEVIVDNGHLLGMEGEDDTGDAGPELGAEGGHDVEDEQDGDDDGGSGTETDTGQGEGGGAYDHGIWSFTGSQTGLRHHGDNNAWEWQGDGDDADDDDADDDDADDDDADDDDADDDDHADDYDDDDDRSSVDSLLDTAMSIDNPTAKEPVDEASHSLRRIDNAKNDTREPVESIWRAPEITPKFSFLTPQPPPSNNKPTINYNPARSVSPPGARSLWAVPQPGRPRKTNTDIPKEKKAKKDVNVKTKPKTSPKKTTAPSTSKPKQFSSPVKKGDWSFAIHSRGSDSESDDPLQEDIQPSPTPKNPLNIRGKSLGSVTPSRNQTSTIDGRATDSKSRFTPKTIAPTPKHLANDTRRRKTNSDNAPHPQKAIERNSRSFPSRQMNHLRDWNKRHWSRRRANPPQLSRPWYYGRRKNGINYLCSRIRMVCLGVISRRSFPGGRMRGSSLSC
ncbi:Myb-like DNA-binding domain protein [Aspergillus glaucus CBS 516.65]|uniref:Uncharacterized protein n=1 Tax=Aspergillus glaucus CBS 516.65 TaxID=1160497 RepID=A0A1L9VXW7_ASPGL|nr:hypothetical protein ASPGLDRAFT_741452 [Aspergillus glaucus CBS 516.65]OJJ88763.1 hypothetical protein ASPGLDRAFT_741452 [Aspergillus glaucus CBS 516.65]